MTIGLPWMLGRKRPGRVAAVAFFLLAAAGSTPAAAQSITVDDPSSSTVWISGTTQTVTWSGIALLADSVEVVMVRSGSTDVLTVLAPTPLVGQGSTDLAIALDEHAGTVYTVRVTQYEEGATTGVSDTSEVFTIDPPVLSSVEVEGETTSRVVRNRAQSPSVNVAWTAAPALPDYDVDVALVPQAGGPDLAFAAETAQAGSANRSLTGADAVGRYAGRVSAEDDATITAETPGFPLLVVDLSGVSASGTWTSGGTGTATWNVSGFEGGDNLDVILRDGGSSEVTRATVPASQQTTDLAIPLGESGSGYTIRVQMSGEDSTTVFTVSGAFSIGSVDLSGVAVEGIAAGTVVRQREQAPSIEVTWDVDPPTSTFPVEIALVPSSGAPIVYAGNPAANAGTASRSLSGGDPVGRYRGRVRSTANSAIADSTAGFVLQVVSLSGAAASGAWTSGGTGTATWNASGFEGGDELDVILRDGGSSEVTRATVPASEQTTNLAIPLGESGSGYTIRVQMSGADSTTVFTVSGAFSIGSVDLSGVAVEGIAAGTVVRQREQAPSIEVTWDVDPSTSTFPVEIALVPTSGAPIVYAGNPAANAGTASRSLSGGDPVGRYRGRVRSTANSAIADSTAGFVLQVVSLSGAAASGAWTSGGTGTATWSASGFEGGDNLDVILRDGGSSEVTRATVPASQQTTDLAIPLGESGSGYTIRVQMSGEDSTTVFTVSGAFSIGSVDLSGVAVEGIAAGTVVRQREQAPSIEVTWDVDPSTSTFPVEIALVPSSGAPIVYAGNPAANAGTASRSLSGGDPVGRYRGRVRSTANSAIADSTAGFVLQVVSLSGAAASGAWTSGGTGTAAWSASGFEGGDELDVILRDGGSSEVTRATVPASEQTTNLAIPLGESGSGYTIRVQMSGADSTTVFTVSGAFSIGSVDLSGVAVEGIAAGTVVRQREQAPSIEVTWDVDPSTSTFPVEIALVPTSGAPIVYAGNPAANAGTASRSLSGGDPVGRYRGRVRSTANSAIADSTAGFVLQVVSLSGAAASGAWTSGKGNTAAWSASGFEAGDQLDVVLLRNGTTEVVRKTVPATGAANTSVTVPVSENGSGYVLRVEMTGNASVFATSGAFAIAAPVLSGVLAEGQATTRVVRNRAQGQSVGIVWDSAPAGVDYAVEVALVGGTTIVYGGSPMASNETATRALAGTDGVGRYKARVRATTDADVTAETAGSPILVVNLSGTTATGTWTSGGMGTAVWSASGFEGGDQLDVVLLRNGTTEVVRKTVSATGVANTTVAVPVVENGSGYVLRVEMTGNATVFAASGPFTIAAPVLSGVLAEGQSTARVVKNRAQGQSVGIVWDSAPAGVDYAVEVALVGGTTIVYGGGPMASAEAATRVLTGTDAVGRYKARVRATADADVTGETAGSPLLVVDLSGAAAPGTWPSGGSGTATWNASGFEAGDQLDVVLLRNGTTEVVRKTVSATAGTSTIVNVPVAESGSGYVLRLEMTGNTGIFTTSAPFAITVSQLSSVQVNGASARVLCEQGDLVTVTWTVSPGTDFPVDVILRGTSGNISISTTASADDGTASATLPAATPGSYTAEVVADSNPNVRGIAAFPVSYVQLSGPILPATWNGNAAASVTWSAGGFLAGDQVSARLLKAGSLVQTQTVAASSQTANFTAINDFGTTFTVELEVVGAQKIGKLTSAAFTIRGIAVAAVSGPVNVATMTPLNWNAAGISAFNVYYRTGATRTQVATNVSGTSAGVLVPGPSGTDARFEVIERIDASTEGLSALSSPFTARPVVTSLVSNVAGSTMQISGHGFAPGTIAVQLDGLSLTTIGTATSSFARARIPGTFTAGTNRSLGVTVNGAASATFVTTVKPIIASISGTGNQTLLVRGQGFGTAEANVSLSVDGNNVGLQAGSLQPAPDESQEFETVALQGVEAGDQLGAVVTVRSAASDAAAVTLEPGVVSILTNDAAMRNFAPVGTQVKITGSLFSDDEARNTVRFQGGTPVNPPSSTPTEIIVWIPNGPSIRSGQVEVSVNGAVNDNVSFGIQPDVADVVPGEGFPGDEIAVTGTGFASQPLMTTVAFDDVSVNVSPSGGAIRLDIPQVATAGPVDLTVQTPFEGDALASEPWAFVIRPKLQGVSFQGGLFVLSGKGFGPTRPPGSHVFVGTEIPPENVASWGAEAISMSLPASLPPGEQPVYVEIRDVPSDSASLVLLPTIIAAGNGGAAGARDSATLLGIYFGTSEGQVLVSGVPVPPGDVTWNPDRIVFRVPNVRAGATTLVVDPPGSTQSEPFPFTVLPVIDDLEVLSGSIAFAPQVTAKVGQTLRIHGAGFGDSQGSSTVLVNGRSFVAGTVVWSASVISGIVARQSCTGGVTVTVSGLSAVSPVAFGVSSPGPPALRITSDGVLKSVFGDAETLEIEATGDAYHAASYSLAPLSGGTPATGALAEDPAERGVYEAQVAAASLGPGSYVVTARFDNGCPSGSAVSAGDTIVVAMGPEIAAVREFNGDSEFTVNSPDDAITFVLEGEAGAMSRFFLRAEGRNDVPLCSEEFEECAGADACTFGEFSAGQYLCSSELGPGSGGTDWILYGELSNENGTSQEFWKNEQGPIRIRINDVTPTGSAEPLQISEPHAKPNAANWDDTVGFAYEADRGTAGFECWVRLVLQAEGGPGSQAEPVQMQLGAQDAGTFAGSLDLGDLALPDGVYAVEYFLCPAGAGPIPGDVSCTPFVNVGGNACGCSSPQTLTIDNVLPEILGFEAGRSAQEACLGEGDMFLATFGKLVVGSDQAVSIFLEPADPGDSAFYSIRDAGQSVVVGETRMVYSQGAFRAELPVETVAFPGDGPYEVLVSLEDGVNPDATETSAFWLDRQTPAGPASVKVSVAPGVGTTPLSNGDVVSITVLRDASNQGEDLLGVISIAVGATHIEEHVMTPEPDGSFRATYAVPVDVSNLNGTLVIEARIQDGANCSVLRTNNAFQVNTSPVSISSVAFQNPAEPSKVCYTIGDRVRFTLQGTQNVRSAGAEILEGESVFATVTLLPAGPPGTYAGEMIFADAAALRDRRIDFAVRGTLARSDANSGASVASEDLRFDSTTPDPPALGEAGPLTANKDAQRPEDPDSLLSATPTFRFALALDDDADLVEAAVAGRDPVEIVASNGFFTLDVSDLLGEEPEIGADGWEPYAVLFTQVNACGNTSPAGNAILVVDAEPPQVTYELPEAAFPGGQDLTIEAVLTDNRLVESAELHYTLGVRDGGDLVTGTIAMTRSAGVWSAVLPIASSGQGGIRFSLIASDGLTVGIRDYLPRVALPDVRLPQLGAEDWHLVSSPAELVTKDPNAIFPGQLGTRGEDWDFWRWDPTRSGVNKYARAGQVLSGAGYWIKWRELLGGSTVGLGPAETVPLVGFTIALHPGWNQIASPFGVSVEWPPGLPLLREWSEESKDFASEGVQRMDPARAYFVSWSGSGIRQVVVDPAASLPVKPSPLHPAAFAEIPGAWSIKLVLETSAGIDGFNYAGARPDASDGADLFDLEEIPPPAPVPALSFESEEKALAADVRAPLSADLAAWSIVVASEGPEPDAKLSWDWIDRLPETLDAVLWDATSLESVDLRAAEEREIDLVAGGTYRLTLFVGRRSAVEAAVKELRSPTPAGFRVYPAFPNPFSTVSRIRYELPSDGDVEVEILDVRGGRVAGWRFPAQSAGLHVFTWDGRDDAGRAVVAGVYLARVRAGAFSQATKLVMIGQAP